MDKPVFVYVTYIASTPDRVWAAITDPQIAVKYWGKQNLSDWQPGSRWEPEARFPNRYWIGRQPPLPSRRAEQGVDKGCILCARRVDTDACAWT